MPRVRAFVPRRPHLAAVAGAAALAGLVLSAPVAGAATVLPGRGPARAAHDTTTTVAPAPTSAPTTTPATRTCTPGVLVGVRHYVVNQLAARSVQLNVLSTLVTRSQGLTAADRATLTTDLANERAGIAALQAKVPGDTTCAMVLADGRAMVTDYRVYVVMSPQVRLTVAADSETALAGRFQAAEPSIQSAIDGAQAAGTDVTAAQAAMADLQHQVSAASAAATGIAAQVLAFTPASYPACWPAFQDDQARLHQGGADLHQADTDLHTIEAAVRGAAPSSAAT